MRAIISLTAVILLSACASGKGTSAPSPLGTKAVFSKWSSTQAGVVDLTSGVFGQDKGMDWHLADGSICSTIIVLYGDEKAGTWYINYSIYKVGSGPADPGCPNLVGGGTFTNNGTSLNVCRTSNGSGCSTFQ